MLALVWPLLAHTVAPLSVERLSVNLLPTEHKLMSAASASVAASILNEHGVVLLRNAIDVDVVDQAAEAVAASYERCKAALKERKLRPTDGFAFAEIAHRSKLRWAALSTPHPCPRLHRGLQRAAHMRRPAVPHTDAADAVPRPLPRHIPPTLTVLPALLPLSLAKVRHATGGGGDCTP
jgi:hypothetical protein